MKKGIITLLVVVFAAFFAVVSVQPALAGSKEMPSEKISKTSPVKAAKAERVNINTADEATLANLEGIGPELAKRIIDYRSKNGKFKSIIELKNVKGIGDKLFAKLAPVVTIK